VTCAEQQARDGCGILQRWPRSLRWIEIENAIFERVAVLTDRRVVAAGALATFTWFKLTAAYSPAFSTILRKGSSGERARMRMPAVWSSECVSVFHGIAQRESPVSVLTAHAERKIRSQTMREKCAINSTAVTPI
jgi:hypothetical protein